MGRHRQNMVDCFMAHVSPEPMSGCWLWDGALCPTGYAKLHVSGTRRNYVRGHRFAYQKFVGPIPSGMGVCHTCDVPSCVNPVHLFVGTQSDNMTDCSRKGRINRTRLPRTHCREGHPYAGDNLRVYASGRRVCRICTLRNQRRQNDKRKVERTDAAWLASEAKGGGA